MGRVSVAGLVLSAVVFATVASPVSISAQTPQGAAAKSSMKPEEITEFAKIQIAIAQAHDSVSAEIAQPRNKKAETQDALQAKLRTQVTEILHHGGMTEVDYRRKTYAVSTEPETRKSFDSVVAKLTGVPTPGQVAPSAPPRVPPASLPAGAVGTHIGHVINGFADTPNGMGLLPTAMAEAKTAAQHAGLAARDPNNLDAMKLHAGHVINALDPTIVAAGPGLGYGVKRAALGAATHIELAAKAPGASPNVIMHAQHVATASRNAVARADQMIAIAKQVQAATAAPDAAALISQLVSLSQQLIAGADTNGDGRIGWEEGGLQLADDHVMLMIAGEAKKP
ncbi:MAG: hypothetical protein JWM41_3090 [Gemmatimonadetes bacterium]|nr:hypothetical protein [Gemmatimonadota bacterium]